MEQRATNGRRIVGLVYVLGALSFAVVGLISPLAHRVTDYLHAAPGAIGLTIALFSLPAAIVATAGGSIVDRLGPRLILIAAPLLIAAADLLLVIARSLWAFDLGMLVAGAGFTGIVIGAPAMMIGALDGPLRTRAMALWSTFSPTGFSFGLLMAVPFTAGLDWHVGIAAHGLAMLALAALAALLLPPVAQVQAEAGEPLGARIARLFVVVHDPAARRLALTLVMPNMISYGTSLVAVTYLSRVHGVSLAASATTVAVAKIAAMLLGGTIMGALLARDVPPRRLFVIVVLAGIVAQILLFLPYSPLPLAVAGLMLWLFSYGGASGVCMAIMPTLASEHVRGGSLAGLVNQVISIGAFLTPTIYFAMPGWQGFIILAVAAGLISLISLPAPRAAVAAIA